MRVYIFKFENSDDINIKIGIIVFWNRRWKFSYICKVWDKGSINR